MAEFPALPLWTDALLGDTFHLTDAEFGRYLRLLILMWRTPHCRIPNDDAWIARKLPTATIEDIRTTISEFCQTDGNWIVQKRLRQEFLFLQNRHDQQGDRAMQRWDSDRQRANALKRSQRMAAARRLGTHTKIEWQIMLDIFDCCVHCGTTEFNLEKDHIMPVYQGGSDAIENLQPSCARCNARKGPENDDKRSGVLPGWDARFEQSASRKLLRNSDNSVCLTGRRFSSAPTPTPTPIKVNVSLRDTCQRAVEMWNDLASKRGLAQVQRLTQTRSRKLGARLAEIGGPDGWAAALGKIDATPGLWGNGKGSWRINFDWMLSPSNLTKLMEGNYDGWTEANQRELAPGETERAILRGLGLDKPQQ